MSDDLIRRSDAVKKIKWWFDIIDLNPDILIDSIITLPTIEPKRGEWIQKPHKVYLPRDCEPLFEESYDEADHSIIRYWWHCSNCNHEADEDIKPRYNYCPICGADMRKETVDYKHVVLTCDDEGNWSMYGE